MAVTALTVGYFGLATRSTIFVGFLVAVYSAAIVLRGLHARGEVELVINDPDASIRVVRAARALASELHILVRTRYLADVQLLESAGADAAIVEEAVAAEKMAQLVLERRCKTPVLDNGVNRTGADTAVK